MSSVPQTSREFSYREFNDGEASTHIRVIRIKPECGEPIQCVMKHMERPASRSESSYSCLSYTWDPKEPGRPIYIEGEDINEGTKSFGKNLGDFLGAARDAKVTDWLWIDALCINQDNVSERAQQVRQMGQTYQQAKKVFVWLGLISESIIHTLENMVGVEEKDPSAHREIWLGHLSSIFSIQYWTRLWIAQEFVLPDDPILFFQNFQISSHRLALSMKRLMIDERLRDLPAWKYFWWRLIRYESVADRSNPSVRGVNESVSLASLIRRFSDSGCADKRDRIYGLLSFDDDGDSELVDYTASEDAVFRNTMALMKRHKRALDELLLIGEALIESLELWQATIPSSSSLEINFDGCEDITLPVWGYTTLELHDGRSDAEDAGERVDTACMYVGIRDGPDVHVFEYSVEKPKERPIVKYCRAYEYLRGRPPASFVPAPDDKVVYFWLDNMPSEALHYFVNPDRSTRRLWSWAPREFDISGLSTDESTEQNDRDILPAFRIVNSTRSTLSLPWEGYIGSQVAQPFVATFNLRRLIDESREYKSGTSVPPLAQHSRSTTLRLDINKYLGVYEKKK